MPKTTEDLIALLDTQHNAIKAMHQKTDQRIDDTTARLTEVEQTLAQRRSNGGIGAADTLGGAIIKSEGYKQFIAAGCRGTYRIPLDIKAALTLLPSSGGALSPPDFQREVVMIPRVRLTVRNLLAPGQTNSNLVKFTRQTTRTNAAAVVTEGSVKPESNIIFELVDAPVRTIATFIPASRQVMDDAPLLQSTLDSELRYMIGLVEEEEILFGDGSGEHLKGLSTQVAPFNAPFVVASQTNLDIILVAIAQAQQSRIMATGVIVNDLDWKKMQALKDTQGRYIGGGPFGTIGNSIWTLPVVDTPAMPVGEFMVGAFSIGAQLIDRMQTEVLVSSESSYTSGGSTVHGFTQNMLVIRAEERVALAVKIPNSIVYGDFTTAT